jgi:hypothetical protein
MEVDDGGRATIQELSLSLSHHTQPPNSEAK